MAMKIDLCRVLDGLPAMVWAALPDGHIDFINRRWSEYTGLSFDEAGREWQAAINPDDLPQVLQLWRSMVATGEPGEMEVRLRGFDGPYRRFLVHGSPLRDDCGRIVRWCGLFTDIEDIRRADEILRRRELDFQLIVDSIPVPVAVTTPSGEVEGLNRSTLDYFGRTLEELKDWRISDVVHPEDLQRTVASQLEAHRCGTSYNVESRHRRADGVYRWHNVRGFPLRDPQRRILRWFHLLIDIDDRKRAEEALQATERTLTEIINTIPALAWAARPDGTAEFFNQHYLDYVGLAAEQAQDWDWTVAVHPDDLKGLAATWQTILASGRLGETEARLRRFDGAYRWFLFRTNPLRDEKGNIVKWYGTNTDIDDRKRAEQELRRSEAFLADAQRLSRTGSFSWRVATEEVRCSVETYRIFGLDPAVPVTFDVIRTRVHPDNFPMLQKVMDQARCEGGDFDYETRLLMPDNSVKYLRVFAHSDRNNDGELELRGAVQDVTESRLAEEALSKARSELAHIARLTTLGELTASIAHEVSQPLSGILTNASSCLRMLAADPPNVEGASETARRTIRDGNRMADVVARLRALFNKRIAAIEPVDLNEAAREVIALLWSDFQRSRVVLRTELAEGLPPVSGDRVLLQQVIMNLLRNAADAMSGVEDRPRRLVISSAPSGDDHVRLSVEDAGIGFGAEDTERLFEPFYTTKSDGMGIGLSVSRSIVESHRGRLWAAPNDGPGVTFSFSIPVSLGAGPAANGLSGAREILTSSIDRAERVS